MGAFDLRVGLRAFVERKLAPIDLLVVVSGGQTRVARKKSVEAPLADDSSGFEGAWIRLAAWEGFMGAVVCSALAFGLRLIVSAPDNIVTVFDFTKCYTAPPVVQPCERVAYRAGTLNVVLNAWCGLLLVGVAVVLLWQLWAPAAPKPITDEFLKLLDDSFGRDWRRLRTWPWRRIGWAYGFTLVGAFLTFGLGMLVSTVTSSRGSARTPTVHIETFERFRPTAEARR